MIVGREANNIVIPSFSNDQRYDKLNQAFTKMEMFNALKSMPSNKCPGLDGLSK